MEKIKFNGIKKAAGETKLLRQGDGCKVEIAYNKMTGDITARHMTASSYTAYDDANIIVIDINKPSTMQEIKNKIERKITEKSWM